ncbi:hypothetical protein P2318_24045 [Myxococcaceae bacterium GXIMD 01537]
MAGRRRSAKTLALLVLGLACRTQGDAAAGAAPGPCERVWREAQVDVTLRETREAAEPPGPLRSRTFTVTRQQRGAYRYKDQWASVLEYPSGAVSYTLAVPDVLADLTGRAVRWESFREAAPCLGGDGQHPALVAGDTLRDDAGSLLVFTSPSLPLLPDGAVLLPPGLGFEARWEEAGCAAEPGAPSRGVRLRLTGPEGAPVTVRVGETRQVELARVRYEARLASAQADTRGRCGQAVLALYRVGLRQQRAEK